MKLILSIGAAMLSVGLWAGTATVAAAQSDRTLGINCTVAGHVHCGENGTVGYRWHRHYRHRHVARTAGR
jgi:hypothetical protein